MQTTGNLSAILLILYFESKQILINLSWQLIHSLQIDRVVYKCKAISDFTMQTFNFKVGKNNKTLINPKQANSIEKQFFSKLEFQSTSIPNQLKRIISLEILTSPKKLIMRLQALLAEIWKRMDETVGLLSKGDYYCRISLLNSSFRG